MKKLYNSPDELIEFGKYKGHTIKRVIEIDPKYLLWACENIPGFDVSEAIYNAINEAMIKKGIR